MALTHVGLDYHVTYVVIIINTTIISTIKTLIFTDNTAKDYGDKNNEYSFHEFDKIKQTGEQILSFSASNFYTVSNIFVIY